MKEPTRVVWYVLVGIALLLSIIAFIGTVILIITGRSLTELESIVGTVAGSLGIISTVNVFVLKKLFSLNDKINKEIGCLSDKISVEIGKLNDKISTETERVKKDTFEPLITRIDRIQNTLNILRLEVTKESVRTETLIDINKELMKNKVIRI